MVERIIWVHLPRISICIVDSPKIFINGKLLVSKRLTLSPPYLMDQLFNGSYIMGRAQIQTISFNYRLSITHVQIFGRCTQMMSSTIKNVLDRLQIPTWQCRGTTI